MSYQRDTLAGLTPRQRAMWERQARSITDRARRLMAEVINSHGVEHRLTDFVDDVLCTAESLTDALKPEKTRSK